MIGFEYPGAASAADGASVFMENPGVDESETPSCSPPDLSIRRSTAPCPSHCVNT
jgi:hypothetical protein